MAVPALAPISGLSAQAGAATAHHAAPNFASHATPLAKSHASAPHTPRPLLGAAPHLAAAAATFTVNTTTDSNDATPGDGICADTGGLCSLRAAIEEANADGTANPTMGTTAVVVPAGTYTLSLGTELDATDPAGLDIIGAGAGSTVIQQMASPTDRVLQVSEATSTLGANVMLSGATIQGGSAGNSGGGGIEINDNNDLLQLVNVTVTGNAAGFGGGIYNDGNLWTTNSSVSSNAADDSNGEPEGGGLYNDDAASLTSTAVNNNTANSAVDNGVFGGGILNDGSLFMEGGSIAGNSISTPATDQSAQGGGLYAEDTTELSGVPITSNSVTANATNRGAEGGGIYDDFGLGPITNLTLSGNSANDAISGGFGGAIFGNESLVVSGSTLDHNTASGDDSGGGALYLNSGGFVTGTTVTNNTAGNIDFAFGGGIYTDSPLVLTTSTVAGNSANEGGGLYLDDTLQAENSTIANNSTSGATDQGGGVFLDNGSMNLKFVTLNGNTSDDAPAIFNNDAGGGSISSSIVQAACDASAGSETIASGGHNVLGDSSCVTPTSSDLAGVSNFRLSTLGNNGGPTQTMVPAPSSPAIGAGGTACPPTDQRGVNRPQGAACDSGAVEINQAYWMVASDGGIFTFGGAGFFGSMGGIPLNKPMVGIATTPDAKGYWTVASDGGIFSFGDASFFGSMGGKPLNKPMVGMAVTPDGGGYWTVASDGGIFSFGDATFYGSMGGKPLNKPIVGMAAAAGGGYWEVASDGGIFSFGPGAGFHGSAGSLHLNAPVVGMAATPDGGGYWTVASDGGIFNYGDAGFFGSMGGIPINKPVVGVAGSPVGQGYWEAASDGGIFAFGDAVFQGSMGAIPLNKPVVGITSS